MDPNLGPTSRRRSAESAAFLVELREGSASCGATGVRGSGALAVTCVLFTAPAGSSAGEPVPSSPDTPSSAVTEAGSDSPVNLFLGQPADLNALWKTLTRPDFVILRGDEYNRLRDRASRRHRRPPGPLRSSRSPLRVRLTASWLI